MEKRFEDKRVLVTGASKNTGVAIARLFIEEGAKVCICGSTDKSTDNGKAELERAGCKDFLAITCDISNLAQVRNMFAQIMKNFGGLDILVNNACNQGIGEPFEKMDPEFFLMVIKTNLLGGFQVSQEAVKIMLKQPTKGVIVNLGSNVSMRAIHNRTAYIASKGGIDALTRSMAIDLAPKGIRVNEVAPGYIRTDRWNTLGQKEIDRRHANTPLGIEATGRNIADAVAFMASDASANICGERLVVDGGCSAQHMPPDIDF